MNLFEGQPWRSDAACRGRSLKLFFLEPGDQGTELDPARQVCAGCPVKNDCAEYAIANADLYGVWGGLTTRQRRAIREERRRRVA